MYYLGLQLEDLRACSSVLYASTTITSHLRTSKEACAVVPRPRLSVSTCPPSKRCTTDFSGNGKSPGSCVLPAALSSTAQNQSSELTSTSVILTAIFLQPDTSCPHLGRKPAETVFALNFCSSSSWESSTTTTIPGACKQ